MTTTDDEFMAQAIAAADVARLRTAPNPWVGCVLVRDGVVLATGASQPPGGRHAEVEALAGAGDVRGATAYVTLEPCAHHGRTPPCAEALVAAGVSRVVAGIEDPDSSVAGKGHERLRDAGIEVLVGVGAATVSEQLAPYLHQRRTGRAFSLIKTAMSLDGRTSAADGSSQWITGPAARADSHRLRAESQAIIVGPATARADRPSLTVRDVAVPPNGQPLRVLLDAKGAVPVEGPLFDTSLAPTLVFTTSAAPGAARAAWAGAGVEVEIVAPGISGRGVDLPAVFRILGSDRGVLQAMVEGGGKLHGALVAEGLADRIMTYVAPVILGEQGRAVLAYPGASTLADAPRWHVSDVRPIGVDVRVTYDRLARSEVAA
ncbi:MAG: bifunctional diaminohydroxyphosphoribosylaminopyrimidine deaminase/5-amino-6-(5-phosphoribosylamino)uracil reductase RibD [Acidimicrobiia bacterium]|nr:bifunctional diaminohydroxyphosphoribosylaminopyrimidine deaminase/5-amino-6-(5-phosphoribosylamino)uracil reductase RibD [Acidimicrobiia bacterium]